MSTENKEKYKEKMEMITEMNQINSNENEIQNEMKIEEKQIDVSLVVFGITGAGKSTLSNTLTESTSFKESCNLFSETDKTVGMKGTFDGQTVFVIDTPGLQDNRGTDTKHLKQMTKYIKRMTSVKAFVFVINFTNFRFDQSVIRLFQLLSQMYPEKKWYHHIAIVWTNVWQSLPPNVLQTKDIKKKESLEMIKNNIVSDISDQELQAIPQYFIDSIDAREKDSDSRNQLSHLIAWIAQLRPLSETLGEIQKVDKDVQKEEIQTERRTVSDVIELNIQTIETALFERSKKTLYNGDVLYTDWVEKEGTRLKEKRVLIPPPPDMKVEYRDTEKLLSERRQVDNVVYGPRRYFKLFGPKSKVESGRIMQKKRKTKERRYLKVFHTGKTEYTPWEICIDVEEEIVIGQF